MLYFTLSICKFLKKTSHQGFFIHSFIEIPANQLLVVFPIPHSLALPRSIPDSKADLGKFRVPSVQQSHNRCGMCPSRAVHNICFNFKTFTEYFQNIEFLYIFRFTICFLLGIELVTLIINSGKLIISAFQMSRLFTLLFFPYPKILLKHLPSFFGFSWLDDVKLLE